MKSADRTALRAIKVALLSSIILALYLSCVLTLLSFLDKLGRLWSLPCHFRLQYLGVQLLALTVLLPARAKQHACLAAVFALVNLVMIAPYFLTQSGRSNTSFAQRSVLHLLQYNINSQNKNYRALIRYARATNPDLIAIEEATPECCSALSKALPQYPYTQSVPRWDNFGLLLLSRFPLMQMETLEFPEGLGSSTPNSPTTICRVALPAGSVTLVHTHLLNASTDRTFALQSLQVEKIAASLSSIKGDFILVGDLNTTPWCFLFPKLTGATGLRGSGRLVDLALSWPTSQPLLRIPIDHCLASDRLTVIKQQCGPQLGSDHFPIYSEIAVPR